MTANRNQELFEHFVSKLRPIVTVTADSKGYKSDGVSPAQFIQENFGIGHHLGEIVLKAIRFNAKGLEEDLLKIAGWAYVIWRDRFASKIKAEDEVIREQVYPVPYGDRRRDG